MMCVADTFLHHTYGITNITVLQRLAQIELEEPETGHTRTIDYASKLKMKKKRSQNPSRPSKAKVSDLEIYYMADGALSLPRLLALG